MLFNSYIFIFLFLPVVLAGFYLIGARGHHRVAISWLVGASLFFYGWWNPVYLGLILGSILFNYATGVALGSNHSGKRKGILTFGVAVNLGLLGYFKYANFFVDNINGLFGSAFHLETIILPLAISFYTFQQIAYLVDAYRGETREYSFLHYCLFVTFFPQLIAGPIVHHKEMLPQFARDIVYRLNLEHLAIGLTIFIIGLFKKVVLADSMAVYATPVFDAAEQGISLTLLEAWGGALAYTLQLYFDFSGYSDMAIGLARMFGILLPLNFSSPYKAVNIIDFWRRWHITLSRFLRDYLYIPFGGNRKGKARRYVNLMATMLLGGLWHGAGWTFVLWGALHGFYLTVNHAWHALRRSAGRDLQNPSWPGLAAARTFTFVAVVVSWVIFRAESLGGAANVLIAMSGARGISSPAGAGGGDLFVNQLANWSSGIPLITLFLLVAWFMPNTQQIMIAHKPALEADSIETGPAYTRWLRWKPGIAWSFVIAFAALVSIYRLSSPSEFLYFQF
ncbi:MAG: MBOAT family O-acyltransferase [Thiogranum sp.]